MSAGECAAWADGEPGGFTRRPSTRLPWATPTQRGLGPGVPAPSPSVTGSRPRSRSQRGLEPGDGATRGCLLRFPTA